MLCSLDVLSQILRSEYRRYVILRELQSLSEVPVRFEVHIRLGLPPQVETEAFARGGFV